jgi:predicted nucleic acid-binding protein
MILLDTNVVSELMLSRPNPSVLGWLNRAETQELYVSSVSVAEIYFGLELLSTGARREDLLDRFGRLMATAFDQRVLDFDVDAARVYGRIAARRRNQGRPLSMADGQIAATARSHSLVLATRNVRDFEGSDVDVLNPFDP